MRASSKNAISCGVDRGEKIERIRQLPRSKQRFVIEVLDTVLAQQDR